MNLYRVDFTHYSPKDSEEGVWGFVLAEDDAQVFDKLTSGPCYWIDEPIEIWDDEKDEAKAVSLRDHIIKMRGDYWEEVSDLYYGATQYKWELVVRGDVSLPGPSDPADTAEMFREIEANLKLYGLQVLT